MTRTSTLTLAVPPTGSTTCSCSARSTLACVFDAHVGNLVEKQRAAIGQLELAAPVRHRPGERALHVSEQLALDQLLGDCGTVHLDERTPVTTIERAVEDISPAAVVLAATMRKPLRAVEQELATLTTRVPVALGGRAANATVADRVGALLLEADPHAAATNLAARIGQVASTSSTR